MVAVVALAIAGSGGLLRPAAPFPARAAGVVIRPSSHHVMAGWVLQALVAGEMAPAAPVVTVASASATPAKARAGDTEHLAATISTNTTLTSAVVDFEVYNAEGRKVYQTAWPTTHSPAVVSLVAGRPLTFQTTWHVPGRQPSDIFTFKVGIFGAGWKPLYTWDNAAATFTVGTPVLPAVVTVTSALVAPVLATAGTAEHLMATISTTATINSTIVDFELYSAGGKRVFQQFWPNTASPAAVNLVARKPVPFHVTWHIPAGTTPGIYTLKVGVFGPGWSRQYTWVNNAATFAIH